MQLEDIGTASLPTILKIRDIGLTSGETVRREDPTMPAGKEIKIEEARDGFKATITRKVVQDGKVVNEQKFVTSYRPYCNVIVVGTKPSSSSPQRSR